MKRTLLYAILIFSCHGFLFAQENSAKNIEELTTRLTNIGAVSEAISEYFTAEELILLQNHFNNNRETEIEKLQIKASNLAGIAYCSSSNGEFGSFVPPSGEVTVIGTSGISESAGAINPNNPSTAYVFNGNDDFFSVNVATGTYTLLGNIPGSWLGAEFHPVTGILYAISDDQNLYSIDTTAISATLIGDTGIELLIALAIDDSGNAYSYSVLDDNLYSINLSTGAATLIGSIGFDANFAQGMFWHEETDAIYMAAFNNAIFDAELRSVNTVTGETTFLSLLGDLGSLSLFGWASSASEAPGPEEDIFQTWYLMSMYSEEFDITISDIEPPIVPTFILFENLEFSGEGACNTFTGSFSYDSENDVLLVETFLATDMDCGEPSHNDFELTYFGYFFDEMFYAINTGDNGEQYLSLDIPIFAGMNFRNVLLSNPDFELNTIKIYPNPVSDQLFIISENYEIETIMIFSALGKKIVELEYIENFIDVSHLSEGMYFIEVTTSEGKSVQKFIKK